MSARKPSRRVKAALACLMIVFFGCLIGLRDFSTARAMGQSRSSSAAQTLREAIIKRVGSLAKLQVPKRNEDLPQPLLDDGSPDPLYKNTEAKRYLGKQLYFDPVRTDVI